MVDLSEEISLGDCVYNLLVVLLEICESFGVFPLLEEATDAQEGNLTDFVRLHTLLLGTVLHVELEHALDCLVAPIVVPALVARACQLDPVLHDRGLEE